MADNEELEEKVDKKKLKEEKKKAKREAREAKKKAKTGMNWRMKMNPQATSLFFSLSPCL